jgi:hypothetical protein
VERAEAPDLRLPSDSATLFVAILKEGVWCPQNLQNYLLFMSWLVKSLKEGREACGAVLRDAFSHCISYGLMLRTQTIK